MNLKKYTKKQLCEMISELDDAVDKARELRIQNEQLETALYSMNDSNKELLSKIEKLEAELTKAFSKLGTLHTEHETALKSMNDQNKELLSKNEKLEAELESAAQLAGTLLTERDTRAKIKKHGRAAARAELAEKNIELETMLGTDRGVKPRIILITWRSYEQLAIPDTDQALEYIISNFDSIESIDYVFFETV